MPLSRGVPARIYWVVLGSALRGWSLLNAKESSSAVKRMPVMGEVMGVDVRAAIDTPKVLK